MDRAEIGEMHEAVKELWQGKEAATPVASDDLDAVISFTKGALQLLPETGRRTHYAVIFYRMRIKGGQRKFISWRKVIKK